MKGIVIPIIIVCILCIDCKNITKRKSKFCIEDSDPASNEDEIKYPPNYCGTTPNESEFDFIIAGGGPAGVTLASRLAEVKKLRILLIEAGSDPPETSNSVYNDLYQNSSILWISNLEPYELCEGKSDPLCTYRTAMVLGGNSIVSNMIYARGSAHDYNELEAAENRGWLFKNMLKYFKKLENHVPDTGRGFKKFHSRDGPVNIDRFQQDPLAAQFKEKLMKAASQAGIPCSRDLNGASQVGIEQNPGIVDSDKSRGNILKAYLKKIPDNLKICKSTIVSKIIISSGKKKKLRVRGMTALLAGGISNEITFRARMEYILAAGVLGTPQILERSGIGRDSVLLRAGVKPNLELTGVGENLRERFINRACTYLINIENRWSQSEWAKIKLDIVGYVNVTKLSGKIPNVQILVTDLVQQGATSEWQVSLGISLLRTIEPGSVHITSKSPLVPPEMRIRYITREKETKNIVSAVRLVREIMLNPVLAKYQPRMDITKECQQYDFNSDNEIMCLVRLMTEPMNELVGTAKMGPHYDPNAVVDAELKVHGLPKVRVVDLSILHKHPRGGTLIPTIAVAEKAADLIKKDWEKANRKNNF